MVKQKTQVVRMTPDMARDILKNNTNNRNVKRDRVSLYATEMEKGRWQLNGESIVIDENGNLKDGQHRLMAVVKSQCTVPMVVVTGVDADCSIYDRGSSRSVRNMRIGRPRFLRRLKNLKKMLKEFERSLKNDVRGSMNTIRLWKANT